MGVAKAVYVLTHPKTKVVRYVGATSQSMAKRRALHVTLSAKGTSKCAKWVRSLLAKGLKPDIRQVASLSEEWERVERAYIAMFRSMGKPLLNMADGGAGVGGCRPSTASRTKRSSTLKARYATDAVRMAERQEMARKAARSPEGRAASSARMKAIWADPQRTAEMRDRMKGAKARKAVAC